MYKLFLQSDRVRFFNDRHDSIKEVSVYDFSLLPAFFQGLSFRGRREDIYLVCEAIDTFVKLLPEHRNDPLLVQNNVCRLAIQPVTPKKSCKPTPKHTPSAADHYRNLQAFFEKGPHYERTN